VKAKSTHPYWAAAALLAVTGSVSAEPVGPYVGAAVGYTKMDLSAGDTEHRLAADGFSNHSWVDDDSDTGFRVYGGYQFSPYLAAELAYVDLGKGKIRSDLTAPAATIDTEIKVDGFDLGLKAGYPATDRLALFAKLGLFIWDAKADATANGAVGSAAASQDDNGTDLSYGLGTSYLLSDNFVLRLDWDRYRVGGHADADSDLFSLGAQVHF